MGNCWSSQSLVRLKSVYSCTSTKWLEYMAILAMLFTFKTLLYCFACKLFRKDNLQFVHEGFSDWCHGQRSTSRHEKGNRHLSAMFALNSRPLSLSRIGIDLAKQLITDCNYWKNVLQRVVAVVKFFASAVCHSMVTMR